MGSLAPKAQSMKGRGFRPALFPGTAEPGRRLHAKFAHSTRTPDLRPISNNPGTNTKLPRRLDLGE